MRTATFAFACLLALTALARAEETPRTINTAGEATIKVAPDEVILNLGVEMFNANLDEAKSANDAACARLTKAIKAAGIEDKFIQTDYMQVEIRYEYASNYNKIAGYMARRGYAITLRDPKQIEALVDTALKSGANQMQGLDFRTTELRKHRDAARKLAIKAAKEKAEALAAELSCTVGAPRTISENGGFYGYWGYSWMRGGNYMSQNVVQSVGGPAGEGGETMPLGQIGVNARVNVVFDLIPNPSLGGK